MAIPAYTILPPEGAIRATIALPRSKSVANRALVLAALAGDVDVVQEAGDADDVRILQQLLRERPHHMHCGAGGTTFRFLLAWACVQEGQEHVLTGDPRLLERPHDTLLDALSSLGADITRADACFVVRGKKLRGGSITFDSPVSSQYLSALLLIAPTFVEGLRLRWTGMRLSAPYVRMTVDVLHWFGTAVEEVGDELHVLPTTLKARALIVPRDWSAAAFWYQIVALAPGAEVRLLGLNDAGWQGDAATEQLFAPWVCTVREGDDLVLIHATGDASRASVDLTDTPDLFQALAFTAAAQNLSLRITGLHNLPLKETDRTAAVGKVLAACGVQATFADGAWNTSGTWQVPSSPVVVYPDHDHRMAMSAAPLALSNGGIIIQDPAVVSKSYPGFWDDLRKAGFGVDVV